MKRLLSLSLALCALVCLFVGCGNESSSDVSSNSSQTVEANESWNQICPDPIPDNKRYTVYCLPTSGVKAGIAADPATKVKSVENIGNLYFDQFKNDNHIVSDSGSRPVKPDFEGYSCVTVQQEDHISLPQTYKIGGLVYDVQQYVETIITTEKINLGGQINTYETVLDVFLLNNDYEIEGKAFPLDAYLSLERHSGRLVEFTIPELHEPPENTIATEEEIDRKINQVFEEIKGFEPLEGVEIKEVQRGSYDVFVSGFYTYQTLQIRVDNYYGELRYYKSYVNLQKYIDVIQYYGKSAVGEAVEVLKDSVDDTGVDKDNIFIDFDGNGELYCYVYSDSSYNLYGCNCITRKQYCVKVIENNDARYRFKILDTKGNTVINEDHIYEARVGDGTINGQYYVYIELDRAGTELVKYVTSQSKGQKLPFYLDGELIFEPTVGTTVETGEIHIMVDTKEQAEAIYEKISSAMLGEEK